MPALRDCFLKTHLDTETTDCTDASRTETIKKAVLFRGFREIRVQKEGDTDLRNTLLLAKPCRRVILRLLHNLFDSSHFPALQTDFDAMRMIRGLGKDILDDAFRQLAGALILFQDDQDLHPWRYI